MRWQSSRDSAIEPARQTCPRPYSDSHLCCCRAPECSDARREWAWVLCRAVALGFAALCCDVWHSVCNLRTQRCMKLVVPLLQAESL